MGRERCPNCGHSMGMLREQRQQAGTRWIRLRWLICSQCHHVALEDWTFLEAEARVSDSVAHGAATESERAGD